MTEIHKSLTGFEKYNKAVPIYVEKPFTPEEEKLLRDTIEKNRSRIVEYERAVGEQESYMGKSRFDPKKITHMSRELVEFECPQEVEAVMDKYAKPLYQGDIALCHYNYINYDPKYGEGKHAPILPPHIDADENLVTFNYQIGGNIDDWQLVIDGKHYDLHTGDAIIFSAVNQVHWRPKRKWKTGEFLEIVSFDYCPTTNYRFTGGPNPLDPRTHSDVREKYFEELNNHPDFINAWKQYAEEGLEIGIPPHENGQLL